MAAECEQKTLSFKEKQKLREGELEAIGQAIDVLKGDAVSGGAERLLDLHQRKAADARTAGASFVQLGRSATTSGPRHQARIYLEGQAKKLHSKVLSLISERLAADPFAKVKQLIDNMITRLLEEANADASHEGWCDKEMGESKVTRDRLTSEIDGLNA